MGGRSCFITSGAFGDTLPDCLGVVGFRAIISGNYIFFSVNPNDNKKGLRDPQLKGFFGAPENVYQIFRFSVMVDSSKSRRTDKHSLVI